MACARFGTFALIASLVALSTASAASAQPSERATVARVKRTAKGPKKPKRAPRPRPRSVEVAPPDAKEESAAGAGRDDPKDDPMGEEAKVEPAPVTTTAASVDVSAHSPEKNETEKDKPTDEDATAAREAADRPISIAPLAGFASDGLRFGLGIRAGYTFASEKGGGAYVGGAFMYHLGYSSELSFGGQSFGSSVSAFYPSVEAGYDIRIKRLVVRPYGGVGLLVVNVSSTNASGQDTSVSGNSLAIYPGANISYDIPNTSVFVGGDARILVPFEGSGVSFGAFGSAGMRF